MPHGDSDVNSHEKCMACKCPCDQHKDHTCKDKCEKCGHAHKEDGNCDCSCK